MSMTHKTVVVFEGYPVFCKFVVSGLVTWPSDTSQHGVHMISSVLYSLVSPPLAMQQLPCKHHHGKTRSAGNTNRILYHRDHRPCDYIQDLSVLGNCKMGSF